MWLLLAFGSAFFAGITSILAKCGISKTDSNLATAIRTIVVLIFSWLMVLVVGSGSTISQIGMKALLFLLLSGLATGASWLCYFRALQLASVDRVVPIDKSSTVLTVLLAFVLLGEPVGFASLCGVVAIGAGTLLMLPSAVWHPQKAVKSAAQNTETVSNDEPVKRFSWLLYAVCSAVFAAFTAIFGKIGISGVESNLGTALRTCVVLVMAWVVVLAGKKQHPIVTPPKKELLWICLSGVTTGASWLCYYQALQQGPASVVVPIDKLSIWISILFSYLVFHEKLTKRALVGLVVLTIGTLLMLIH